ncbi:hypothetical protein TRIUR3_29200 [Triticum urartu]|uniref:Uncharacterized protein n=1 Tax=Triticum urartu TaxID=4572 RepID=M7Z889_TRIUA|nr:hypothetical protein TRIUR3_29200 [Triticum urartu]
MAGARRVASRPQIRPPSVLLLPRQRSQFSSEAPVRRHPEEARGARGSRQLAFPAPGPAPPSSAAVRLTTSHALRIRTILNSSLYNLRIPGPHAIRLLSPPLLAVRRGRGAEWTAPDPSRMSDSSIPQHPDDCTT